MANSIEFDNEKFMESYNSITKAEASFESALSSAGSVAGISIPGDYPKMGELLTAINDLKGTSTTDMSNALTMYINSAQHISDLEGIEEDALQEIIDRLSSVSEDIQFQTTYGNYEAGIFYYPVSVVDEYGNKSSYIMQVKVPEGLTENSNPSLYFYMPGAGETIILDKDGNGYHNTNGTSAFDQIINSSYSPDNTIMISITGGVNGGQFKTRDSIGVALRASIYNNLQEVIKKYNVNTNSIHGAGYSINGASGYMFAAEYPDFMTTYTVISDNLYSLNKLNAAEKAGLAASGTAFYLTCSGGEGGANENMMNNYNYLVSSGKNVHFVIMDGCSHDTVPYVFNEAYFNEITNNNVDGVHTFNTIDGSNGNIVHVSRDDMYSYVFDSTASKNSGNGFVNEPNYSLLGLSISSNDSNGAPAHLINENNGDINIAASIAGGVAAATSGIGSESTSEISTDTFSSDSSSKNAASNTTVTSDSGSTNTVSNTANSQSNGSSYTTNTGNYSTSTPNQTSVESDVNKILESNTVYNNLPPVNFGNMTIFKNTNNVLSYGTVASQSQYQSYINSLQSNGYLLQSDGATFVKQNEIITITYTNGYLVINIFR